METRMTCRCTDLDYIFVICFQKESRTMFENLLYLIFIFAIAQRLAVRVIRHGCLLSRCDPRRSSIAALSCAASFVSLFDPCSGRVAALSCEGLVLDPMPSQ